MSCAPGWADALGKELAGDSDSWQRIRARGGRPFKECSDDQVAKAKRGSAHGGRSKRTTAKLEQALGPVESEE